MLTVAENAFIRLTSNIDVANGLANGVRGIIKSIITNDEQSVTAILVQFDDKNVGKKQNHLVNTNRNIQMLFQFTDMVYLFNTKTLQYSAANFHLYWPGQVLSTQFKVSLLTELLLTCQRYLLQDKHM